MNLKPIKRSTLSDAIVEQIKSLIVEGDLKPGDKLPPERELSAMLNVGRTSVREALKALSSIGVIRRKREGTFVAVDIRTFFSEPLNYRLALMQSSIHELFEARRMLEVELAGLAARRATQEDIEQIEKLFNTMDQENARDIDRFIQADLDFHLAVAEAAQNCVIMELMQTVKGLMGELIEAVIKGEPSIIPRSLEFHRRILERIKMQDPVGARAVMTQHLDDIGGVMGKLEKEGKLGVGIEPRNNPVEVR
ncbi:MAG TPA: FadR family transcriptional regulator [Firmicutes bacterium]|nr:FadR family transcriptional regulator [Bacillota bacterium]